MLKFRIIVAAAFASFLFLYSFMESTTAQALPLLPDYHQEPVIRVGLWSNQASILVSADANFVIEAASGKKIGPFTPGTKVAVAARNSGISVNGENIVADHLQVLLSGENKEDAGIEINRRHYRGGIELHRTAGKSGLTVVNTLPVEDYLNGIITREISPDWPAEAIKAQAVAARTYALYNVNKHQEDGYDVCAGTDCQVYGGRDSENPRAAAAVSATYGQVLLYQGRLIPASFFSDGGGYTENSENVWGTYYPFLRAVVDYDQASPHYKWEKQFTPSDFNEALTRAGISIGPIQSVELSPLEKPPVDAADRGVSGRIKTIRLQGSTGFVELSGTKIRSILNLDSTLFDIRTTVPLPKEIPVDITDSYGDHESKSIPVRMPPVQEKTFLVKGNNLRQITGRAGEMIVFTGYGWGHGVGLSQWGAKAMAEKAPVGDATYYKDILRHYYQGVDIQKAY